MTKKSVDKDIFIVYVSCEINNQKMSEQGNQCENHEQSCYREKKRSIDPSVFSSRKTCPSLRLDAVLQRIHREWNAEETEYTDLPMYGRSVYRKVLTLRERLYMPLFLYYFSKKRFEKGKPMKAKSMKKTKTIALFAILTALFMIFSTACDRASVPTDEINAAAAQDIGSGSTVFKFSMVDGDGNVHAWNVHTNASTVGEALLDAGLIDGTTSDFGLMVSHVNGIRADFVEDDAWWAFYIDDEMAMAGVDATEIEEGVTYAFIYTPA